MGKNKKILKKVIDKATKVCYYSIAGETREEGKPAPQQPAGRQKPLCRIPLQKQGLNLDAVSRRLYGLSQKGEIRDQRIRFIDRVILPQGNKKDMLCIFEQGYVSH
jgi:hypothetical protein